jgi:hypothetical protein
MPGETRPDSAVIYQNRVTVMAEWQAAEEIRTAVCV